MCMWRESVCVREREREREMREMLVFGPKQNNKRVSNMGRGK